MTNTFLGRMLQILLLATSLVSQNSWAQPPYVEGNLLVLPVVNVGSDQYRAEFTIDSSTTPISLRLHYAEEAENPISFKASTLVGTNLNVPELSFEGKKYEVAMSQISENPLVFALASMTELSANFPATTLTTFAPNACSADVELLREEEFTVQDHSEGYKGALYANSRIEVATSNFNKNAVIDLVTDRVLVVADQKPAGFPDNASYRSFTDLSVAPDYGDQNDPDYPVAFLADILIGSFEREKALTRSDGFGALEHVLVTGDTLNLGSVGGVVESIHDLRMGVEDALFFFVKFEDNDREYLLKQDRAGGNISLLLGEGDALSSADEDLARSVGDIEPITPNVFDQAISRVEVLDENSSVEGFAYLTVDTSTGSHQCLATDSAINCGGVLVANGEELRDFASDGGTSAAIIYESGATSLDYKVIGNPLVERIRTNESFQGFNFHSFKQPKVCDSRNAAYFVGSFSDPSVGIYDELMRIDESGQLKQLTDFRSLLGDESLKGSVPDEVRRWAIGYNCDAALFMHGPSAAASSQGYEGHWASYVTGETMKIMDDTFKDATDKVYESGFAVSGIDFSTDSQTIANTGPNGEFYLVPTVKDAMGDFVTTYTVATKPQSCP